MNWLLTVTRIISLLFCYWSSTLPAYLICDELLDEQPSISVLAADRVPEGHAWRTSPGIRGSLCVTMSCRTESWEEEGPSYFGLMRILSTLQKKCSSPGLRQRFSSNIGCWQEQCAGGGYNYLLSVICLSKYIILNLSFTSTLLEKD